MTLSGLLPLFCVLGYSEYSFRKAREAEVRQLALRNANLAVSEIQRIFEGVQNLLIAVSEVDGVRNFDKNECARYLIRLQPNVPLLAGMMVADTQGHYRCGFNGPDFNLNIGDRSYFQRALDSRRPIVGGYIIDRGMNRPMLPIAMAMRDPKGVATGILVAGLDLDKFGQLIASRSLPEGGSLAVADHNGIVIAREPAGRFVGTRIMDDYLRLLTAPGPGTEDITSQDGTRRVVGYVPIPKDYSGLYVSVGLSQEASYEAVWRTSRVSLALALSSAFLALLATWFTANRAFGRPLKTMMTTIQRWRAGEVDVRTGFSSDTGELGALGGDLDRMMDELQLHQQDRDLLMNELSHRVKNTLATVMALAATSIGRVPEAEKALGEFNGRIQALGKAHDILTQDRWESAEIGELIRTVTAPVGGQETRFIISGPELRIGPRQALAVTMVMHELWTNAAKYGALSVADGSVRIAWRLDESTPDLLHLSWREENGPIVSTPTQTGFGTRLILRGFKRDMEVSLDYLASGVVCKIDIPLAPPPA
ncbi:sensor histidine kinase [Lacibacterium aquatile]|uniref:histidine kinase n=1 Tax=Lacibacterium aquatile TaxID=1168082 RepID=A0ABW5DSL4_9PROT